MPPRRKRLLQQFVLRREDDVACRPGVVDGKAREMVARYNGAPARRVIEDDGVRAAQRTKQRGPLLGVRRGQQASESSRAVVLPEKLGGVPDLPDEHTVDVTGTSRAPGRMRDRKRPRCDNRSGTPAKRLGGSSRA